MRRLAILLLCLTLSGCDDDGPINRIVVPGPVTFQKTAEGSELTAFRQVYYDKDNKVAMFFVGDGARMSAHFVNSEGLVDSTLLLSRDEVAKRGQEDASVKTSNGANALLARNALPDLSFQVIPAAGGGDLISYRYGKLSFVSYVLPGEKLKMGAAIDMTLLAKLAAAAGIDGSFDSLPLVNDASATPPGRLVRFRNAPDGLGQILADNAPALFREVAEGSDGWDMLDTPAPKSLSDSDAILAIQHMVQQRAAAASSAAEPIDNGAS